jgi:hypothetical protein
MKLFLASLHLSFFSNLEYANRIEKKATREQLGTVHSALIFRTPNNKN